MTPIIELFILGALQFWVLVMAMFFMIFFVFSSCIQGPRGPLAAYSLGNISVPAAIIVSVTTADQLIRLLAALLPVRAIL